MLYHATWPESFPFTVYTYYTKFSDLLDWYSACYVTNLLMNTPLLTFRKQLNKIKAAKTNQLSLKSYIHKQ